MGSQVSQTNEKIVDADGNEHDISYVVIEDVDGETVITATEVGGTSAVGKGVSGYVEVGEGEDLKRAQARIRGDMNREFGVN